MKLSRSCLLTMILSLGVVSAPAAAKEGVLATVYSEIPASSEAGTQLEVHWTLIDEDDGAPFNASTVFVRLIGPTGEKSEAFAAAGAHTDGRYNAIVTVPTGGVSSVEIGVAGTIGYFNGPRERSDALMELANEPIT